MDDRDQEALLGAFHAAVKNNSVDELRAVISEGLDPNAKEMIACTAGYGDQRSLIDIVILGSENGERDRLLEALLKSGADPKQSVRPDGFSALMRAVARNLIGMTRILLESGANANAVMKEGWTVVHWACSRSQDDCAMLDLLKQHGANMDVVNAVGRTPLMMLATHPIRLRWMMQLTPHRINDVDNNNVSVLKTAIDYSAAECVRLALEFGAEISPKNQGEARTANASDYLDLARMTRDRLISANTPGSSASISASIEIVDYLEAVVASRSALGQINAIRTMGHRVK